MDFLEKDLESIIWETDNEKLNEKGLLISGKKFRQLRIGSYGIADLITVERNHVCGFYDPYLNITVYELKKEKIGISAFLQAVGYCKGISTYLQEKKPNIDFCLNIVLCSKQVDTSGNFIFLTDLFGSTIEQFGVVNDLRLYTFNYNFDGISFKIERNYNLTHKGF